MSNVENKDSIGYVHSVQTLGTLDGPGMRFVVFLQGCNLRCGCCHNPDTWKIYGSSTDSLASANGIATYTPQELFAQYQKYHMYYGANGGITVSGGEPLLQADFLYELFTLCQAHNIHTCLDTSGSIFHPQVEKVLSVTDLVLLDIKYTNEIDYQKYVCCSYDAPRKFLIYLNENHIDTWIRQVIIPGLNDNDTNIQALKKIISSHQCVKRYQLLPFHKMCIEKYEALGIPFPFADKKEPSSMHIRYLEAELLAVPL